MMCWCDGSCRYKEWKASHNTELAKVRRQAKQVLQLRCGAQQFRFGD